MNVMKIGATDVLRNPNLDPLDDKQLKSFSPAIFAKSGIEGVSDKYGFVSTISVINAMRESGFVPVEVRQSKRRDENKMPWTKHMLKFRPDGTLKKVQVGDVVPQVVLLNSHDRSSGFQLVAGLYRLVCSNGLLVADGAHVEPIKVPHTVRMVQDIVDKSRVLVKDIDGVYKLREDMLNTPMTKQSAIKFATAAKEFRPPRRAGDLSVDTLLEARRPGDEAMDLWHVFNRIQENMLRGGNVTTVTDGDRTRQVQTRGIGRIERDVQVNSALWSLAVQTIAKAAKSSKTATTTKKAGKKTVAEPATESAVHDIDAELSK